MTELLNDDKSNSVSAEQLHLAILLMAPDNGVLEKPLNDKLSIRIWRQSGINGYTVASLDFISHEKDRQSRYRYQVERLLRRKDDRRIRESWGHYVIEVDQKTGVRSHYGLSRGYSRLFGFLKKAEAVTAGNK